METLFYFYYFGACFIITFSILQYFIWIYGNSFNVQKEDFVRVVLEAFSISSALTMVYIISVSY